MSNFDTNRGRALGLINFPMSKTGSKAGSIPLSNMLSLLEDLSVEVNLVLDKHTEKIILSKFPNIKILSLEVKESKNVLLKILRYIHTQMKIAFFIMKIAKITDNFIFFMMGQNLIIPMIIAKILRKNVIIVFVLSSSKCIQPKDNIPSLIFSKILNLIVEINCILSDSIVLYSTLIIKDYNLEKFERKIKIAYEHSIDFENFNISKKIDDRKRIIGFIGRLSEEKGILNFIETIPDLIKKNPDLEFLIIGDGHLYSQIKDFLKRNNLLNSVKLIGWVPHGELSAYLNEIKLLVVPSYTEGLPNIILEAMASGTPVLSTKVGAIPSVILNNKTGFIMENNSRECIIKNIRRALNSPNLNEIAVNAYNFVKKKFRYENTLKKWDNVLEQFYEY